MPSIRGYHKDIINSTITLTSKRNITDGFINIYIEDMIYKTINITSKTINTNFNLTEYLEGQYNIQLQYAGSNIFADATYNTTLTVNKINTRIYANNITCYKNSQVNLSVSVTNYVDKTDEGILEFILDNESIKTVLVNDTTTVLNYYIPENYEYGDYELLVLYHGSDRYNSSNLTLNLSINKYPLNMYIRNTTFDDENITLNLQLTCYMNKTITDGRVDVYLDDNYVTSTNVTSNLAVIHLPEYVKTNHIYNITLNYYNSSFFSNVSRSQQINISKINTTIKISQYTTNKNILNITTTIYTKDYSNITRGTLEIKIDDKTIYIKDIKTNINQVLYNLTNTKITNHTITAIYNGTNKYQNTTNTTTFEYIPRQTTIYIKTNNTIHTSPLNTITINATLQDYEANPIKTTIPTIIQIKNQTIKTQFTNATLKQTYKIDDIPDQNITITITTQQTPYYKSTTRNITLTIQRNTTNINTNTNIHATKNENITINATLTSNQKQINTTIPLTIQIENQTIKTQFTNGKLNITIPLKGMNKDKYQITLQTQPTTHYKQATKTIHLTLNKRATYIKSQNIQTICGDIAIINATVYDLKTHKPITQKTPYVIKINQVTQTKNTTQNANILYKYTNKKPNQYNITIISGETSLYMKSTWNGTLNLTTKKLKIQSKNINTLTNQKIQINAKILDENKQINTTITIILKINKKTIDTITIKNGIIKYTYQLSEKYSAKKHNITIVTKPTPKYARSETTIQLIINKQYPQIKTTNITAKKSTTIHIKANIQVNNKNINHKIKVNIKLSQKSICTINVTGGKIDYKYKIPNLRPGLYEILIQSSETQIYHHITTYIVLKIV